MAHHPPLRVHPLNPYAPLERAPASAHQIASALGEMDKANDTAEVLQLIYSLVANSLIKIDRSQKENTCYLCY